MELLDFQKALALVAAERNFSKSERIALEDSVGRVLAETIKADRNYPPFNRSAMDGYALHSADYQKGKSFTVNGAVMAGQEWSESPQPNACIRIMTGAAVPAGFDAVIPRELANAEGDQVTFEPDSIKAFQNIAQEGEDIKAGQTVFEVGHVIQLGDLISIASCGFSVVEVYAPLTVGILTTGGEVVDVSAQPGPFEIRNSNGIALQAIAKLLGMKVVSVQSVKDDLTALTNAFQSLEVDVIITSGGVSMGDQDYLPQVFESCGVEKVFHKVAVKPGKPLWFGRQRNGGIVLGLPGNPMSAFIVGWLFLNVYQKGLDKAISTVTFANETKGHPKLTLFKPYYITPTGKQFKLFNGSGDVTGLNDVNGIAIIPPKAIIPAGDVVHQISLL